MIRYITVNLKDNLIEGYECIADIAKRINMSEAYVINAIRSECLVGNGDNACWVAPREYAYTPGIDLKDTKSIYINKQPICKLQKS